MSDKIIDLNLYRKKVNKRVRKSSEDLVIKTSDGVLNSMLSISFDAGYDIADEELVKDLQIVYLLFEASLNRLSGIEDANIEILDNCTNR